MNDQPCPTCGSYADECQCVVKRDYQLCLEALGMDIEPRWPDVMWATRIQVDTDLAAIRQALREYGY